MKNLNQSSIILFACMIMCAVVAQGQVSLPILEDRDGMMIKGYVYSGEQGLESVMVTDGFSVAYTDENGVYYLPGNDKAEFVYVSTPSGYIPECFDGIAKFYQPIENKEQVFQADFALTKVEDDHFRMIVAGDPQMKDNHDYSLFETQALPDIKQTVEKSKAEGVEIGWIALGDICFNTWSTYPRYLRCWKRIDMPMYHIAGNHDKHVVAEGAEQAPEYKDAFGPLYYSFNKGGVHFLMLDNNRYNESSASLESRLTSDEYAWIKKDLASISKDTPLVVCVHQPITRTSSEANSNLSFLELLKPYQTLILSAHKHYGQNLGKFNYLTGFEEADIEERVQTALCGAYWFGDVAKDGFPLGYYIYDFKDKKVSWTFKPLGGNDDYTFKVYDPVALGSRFKVDVNVFDYDSNWTITWKVDGVDKGKMYPYSTYDPHANELYANHEKSWCRPVQTKHIFYGYLTQAEIPFEITVTDRFGRTVTKSMNEAGITSAYVEDSHVSIEDAILTVNSERPVEMISIWSISGKLCGQVAQTRVMDISGLPRGVYVVSYSVQGENTKNIKIFK